MELKNINFTDFIRYSLTGLNFILFVVLLPVIYIFPGQIQNLISETSVLTILLFSMAVGYLMDMLKVYQFSPNFKRNKVNFRKRISEILEVPVEHAGSYFSITSKMWDETSSYNYERRRAEWILVLNTAFTFFVSMIVWIFITMNGLVKNGFSNSLYLPIVIAVIMVILAIRLNRVGTREIEKDDREFILIMSTNKKKIKDAWKFSEKK
jgi:hypothetical protein